MRSLAIPALLLLLGNASPVAAEASRAASLAAVLPDDCPLYTDVDDDLEDMGVDRLLYPEVGIGDVQLLSMVEWGFTGAVEAPEGFGLYLYLYDPQARDWSPRGDVTLSLGGDGGDFYSSSFSPFRMDLLGASDDGTVTKWSVRDADRAYSLLPSSGRRAYRVGSATLRTAGGEDLGFAVGTEYLFAGNPGHGSEPSTLEVSRTPFRSVRADVYPFTSGFGGLEGAYSLSWTMTADVPLRTDIDAFSVVFSLPSWASDFGELESVHYEYWKYRTDWIVGFDTRSDYEEALAFRGVDGLQPDGSYAAGKTPSFGFAWSAPFDYDDLDVDPTATYDTHLGLSRYYNNNVDSGHHELRVDNPSWVMWTGDDPGAEHGYTSGELLDYAGSYALDADPSGDLPVLNGTVPDDLFYVPSYSGDGLFRKYGHVENSISRSDILSLDFDSMASSRFDEWVPLARGFEYRDLFSLRDASGGWVDPSVYADAETLYDVYRAVLTAQDPADASYLFGEGSLPLLDGLSEDDPVVDRIDAEYAEGLASFVEGHGDGSLYRLTYDMGFSNSYRCSAGSAGALDGTWTARTVSASKTDAVFDFRFVDFTFRDGTRTYVLPAASDPFDVTGDPTVPDSGQEGFPRWAAILLGCAVALLALLALSIFFPVFKGVLRGLLYVVQFVIDVVYVVLVWWWLALIRKARGEEIPPLWIFGK